MNAYTYYTDGRAATEATTNRTNYNAVMFQLLGISSTPWVGTGLTPDLHRALVRQIDDSVSVISVSDSEDSDSEDSDSEDSDSEDSDSEDSDNEDNSLIEGNPGGFVRRISFTESELSLDDDDYDALLRELDVPPPNQSTDQHTTDHPVGHQELRQ